MASGGAPYGIWCGAARRRPWDARERGSFTAELAVGLPALMFLLVVGLTAVGDWTAATWVPLVHDWLASGGTAAVVGTRGLLGEGWDSPSLNVVVDLTATEYRLLRYLMLNPRRVLTRAQLLEHVWDYDFNGDARVLETYVSYLRKKLDAHGPSLIHTVRGVGYALRQPRT